MNKSKKFLFCIYVLFVGFFAIGDIALATQDTDILSLKIVPTSKDATTMNSLVMRQKWQDADGTPLTNDNAWFRYKYENSTKQLQANKDLWSEIQWWFINFGTILTFLTYLIRLISNVAIVAGAFFVIKWGYEYALQTFGGKAKTTEYIKNVVIGIFIMSFSYGVIKILAFTFLQ